MTSIRQSPCTTECLPRPTTTITRPPPDPPHRQLRSRLHRPVLEHPTPLYLRLRPSLHLRGRGGEIEASLASDNARASVGGEAGVVTKPQAEDRSPRWGVAGGRVWFVVVSRCAANAR
ncbi:hypothetical protein NL676_029804 [Syzygium grande]|nr:hypothetical protein NL676_029804 [Syzygium grande]